MTSTKLATPIGEEDHAQGPANAGRRIGEFRTSLWPRRKVVVHDDGEFYERTFKRERFPALTSWIPVDSQKARHPECPADTGRPRRRAPFNRARADSRDACVIGRTGCAATKREPRTHAQPAV